MKSNQSSYRDRTQEFLSVVEKQRKSFASVQNPPSSSSSNGIGSNSKEEGPRSAVAVQSEFNRRASKIGLGIHQTSQKLAKLAKCHLTCTSTNPREPILLPLAGVPIKVRAKLCMDWPVDSA
ncbi:hypothetical protein RHMOL_Rhmol01G0080100 [Rhododendron molle]|uniref:Uncharacterized protein n=1 Tax=Rhododendron molle TaxID=49168 RepID=A0ACC0Q0L2_RHOML|nr:hypothetical protein RHMOL_Rhmol01G0080100 [Rhododendron molle]